MLFSLESGGESLFSGDFRQALNDSLLIDSLPGNQELYNGRIWQNQYYSIKGDQFLFSKTFLPGSVTMRGKTFGNISIRYDIFNDEILTPCFTVGIIQLNKEMVDSFSIRYMGKHYCFVNIPADTSGRLSGYFNLLYKGKSELLVKYVKKIEKLSVEGRYDSFYQAARICILDNDRLHFIKKRNDLLILSDDRKAAKDFIKNYRPEVTDSDPETLIPLVRFIDRSDQKY
jgi:hypothetical protein